MTIPYPKRNPASPRGGGYRPAPRPMPTPGARMPLQQLPVSVPPGAGAGLRLAGRLVPWLGLALLAYELYELYHYLRQPGTNAGFNGVSCCADQSQPPGDTLAVIYPNVGGAANCGNGCATNFHNKSDLVPKGNQNSYRVAWYHDWAGNPGVTIVVSKGVAYTRQAGYGGAIAPFVYPHVREVPDPWESPAPWVAPVVDPFSLPIEAPGPDVGPLPYWALPYRAPNPYRSPYEQPQRGPAPAQRPVPVEVPANSPWVLPATVPVVAPSVPGVAGPTIVADPRTGVSVVPPPAIPLLPHPPGPGVWEEKRKQRKGGATWRLTNAVTETRDFVREVWKGLDPSWRAKQNPDLWRIKGWKPLPAGPRTSIPTVQKMLQDISEGVREGKMDWDKALTNLVENQAGDWFWGKVGKAEAQASRRGVGRSSIGMNRPIGLGHSRVGRWL